MWIVLNTLWPPPSVGVVDDSQIESSEASTVEIKGEPSMEDENVKDSPEVLTC